MAVKKTAAKKKSVKTGKSAKKKTEAKKKTKTKTTATGSEQIRGPYFEIKEGRTEVLVLGTAHVSKQSVEDVENAVAAFKPDCVAVELCRPRHEAMLDPDRWRNFDLTKVIKEKKLGLLASSLILSAFQKKIGENSGIKPGAEMLRASELARTKNIDLVFADREIRTTLKRAWGKVGIFSRLWIVSNLGASLLAKEELDEEEIEKMKQDDVLSDLFSNLPPKYKEVKNVIIDERDSYLAENIRRAATGHAEVERHSTTEEKKPSRILAVVGAGHLEGIRRVLEKKEEVFIEELKEVPKKKPWRSVLAWISASVILFLVGLWAATGGEEAVKEALLAWIVARSLGSGIGAVLALANPLTILVTMIMAPLAPFVPGSRLWMFSALTELWLKKPRVQDFENIAGDTETASGLLKSLYRNRVLHIFWIVWLVSLGLTIGNLTFLQRLIAGLLESYGISM